MDAVARRVRHKAFVGRYACVPPHPPRMLATTGACYRKSATSRSRSIRTRPDSMSPKGPAPRGWGAETGARPRAQADALLGTAGLAAHGHQDCVQARGEFLCRLMKGPSRREESTAFIRAPKRQDPRALLGRQDGPAQVQREVAFASLQDGPLLADAIVVACSVAQDVEMEVFGVGRVRARPQHGGEPAAGGSPNCPREQGLRGIRFMADGDTSPIGQRDCRKINGDALCMWVRIAAREPDR